MKKDHKTAFGFAFVCIRMKPNLRGKSGAKRKQSKGENSAAHFQEIQVILLPFHVKPVKILNLKFSEKKRKTVIYQNSLMKSWDFSRSRMTKWIAPLESFREF